MPVEYKFCFICSEQCIKIISSKATRPRALTCGMWHHIVDLYYVCSNYDLGAIESPATGITCFI